jgi:hypothetical protein
VAVHPREHFVDLRDFPGMARRRAIAQQRVRLVENEKSALVGGFLEGAADRFFRVAEIYIREIVRRVVQNDGISALPTSCREVKGARLGVFEISAFFFSETHKPC